MATELLLYTAKAERDILGHAIAFAEHGTFTHAALYRDYVFVEAVFPQVRRRDGTDSLNPRRGASASVELRPLSDELDQQVWKDLLDQVIGHSYSLSTLVADAASNLFGNQAVVRLGGSVVCSSLAAHYAQMIHDPRIPTWLDTDSTTPADLGQMFLGKRAPAP